MSAVQLTSALVETLRHRTAYLDAGPADGPLMIFVHGWPELGLIWRRQIEHSAAAGWRRIAPDMRGYGGPSVPTRVADYCVQCPDRDEGSGGIFADARRARSG